MANIGKLLNLLHKPRKTRPDSWRAPCPAHGGKGYNLAIRHENDTIVMFCFSHGCTGPEVAAAIGLDLAELFPAKEGFDHERRQRRTSFNARDVLRIMAFEAQLVALAARELLDGKKPTEKDVQRLQVAADRMKEAADAASQ